MSFWYTLPTIMSRVSWSMSLASESSVRISLMSLSRLQVIAVVMMEFTMEGPRPESFRPWYDEMSSLSSFSPLYRPALSAGGVR